MVDAMNECTPCDLLKGRLIDLRRQRELHSLQVHGLCRGVEAGAGDVVSPVAGELQDP